MFMVDDHYQILQPTSQFFAAQLLTQEWAQPEDAEHLLYRAASDVRNSAGHVLVTAYALHRPDGQWSLMLINKDHDHSHRVSVSFRDKDANRTSFFAGQVTMITLGKEQYQWHPDRKRGHADPDGPPVRVGVNANHDTRSATCHGYSARCIDASSRIDPMNVIGRRTISLLGAGLRRRK